MVGGALVNINKIFCHENPCSLFGFVIVWLRSSRTDFIWTPCKQRCGQDQTCILECALHASEKAEQQEEMRTVAFLALVGIGFRG